MSTQPKVLNRRRDEDSGVYVGRPTKWGNPFKVGSEYAQGEAARAYRAYLWGNATLLRDLHELYGHNLVCWCSPAPCHADALLAAAKWAEANPNELASRILELEL